MSKYENYRVKKSEVNQEEISSLLKIDQYLRKSAILERSIKIKEERICYMEEVCEYLSLNTYKNNGGKNHSFQSLKSQNSIKKLANSSMKLINLTNDALTWDKSKLTSSKLTLKQNQPIHQPNSSKYKVSTHLKTLLNTQSQKIQTQLTHLEKQKQKLYQIINDKLSEDEPYMHEKIIAKIQKDVNKNVKMFVIKQLEGIIKQKKNWLEQNKKKIDREILMKNIEQIISSNLCKMKEIMTVKIQISEYIGIITENSKNIGKNKQKIQNLAQQIEQKMNKEIQKFKQYEIELSMQELTEKQKKKDQILSQNYIQQINSLIQDAYAEVVSPICSKNSEKLLEEVQILLEEVNDFYKK